MIIRDKHHIFIDAKIHMSFCQNQSLEILSSLWLLVTSMTQPLQLCFHGRFWNLLSEETWQEMKMLLTGILSALNQTVQDSTLRSATSKQDSAKGLTLTGNSGPTVSFLIADLARPWRPSLESLVGSSLAQGRHYGVQARHYRVESCSQEEGN